MVPRCVHYRLSIHEIAPTPGFRLPDRDVALAWMKAGIARGSGSSTHHDTLAAPLAWVPYPRSEREKLHDAEALLRYLKRAWDDLSDEAVATLITVGVAEARAMMRYRGTFELVDPTTLAAETWIAARWAAVMNGEALPNYDYLQGWPQPWVVGEAAG